MHLFEVEFAEKKWSIKVESRQSQLSIAVSLRYGGVVDMAEFRDETAERWPVYVFGYETEVILLSDMEVGLVLDQVAVRPQEPSRSLA
jgi:hypothetical protein